MARERFHPDAAASRAMVQAAIAAATERRRQTVQGAHLLWALLRDERGPAVAWLARYGGDAGVVRAELERAT